MNDLGIMVKQHASPSYQSYLKEIAKDAPAAWKIYTETGGVSVRVSDNPYITAGDTILLCNNGFPFLDIWANTMIGSAALRSGRGPPIPARRWSPLGRRFAGPPPPGATWQPQTTIRGNQLFIPASAPHLPYREVGYFGVTSMAGNVYTTDSLVSDPRFAIAYDNVGTVVLDQFPTDGRIIPVHENGTPYPLSSTGYFSIP